MSQEPPAQPPTVADVVGTQTEDVEILDAQGNAVTGGLTKDMTIRWVGFVAFIILFSSWTTQWVAFALPYWKSDKYHNAGLFSICSHAEWEFVNVTRIMCPSRGTIYSSYECHDITLPGAYSQTTQELVPGAPVEKCQSINDYVADFKKIVCIPPYEQDQYCFYSDTALSQIVRSRWFEAVSTTLDMIFGLTTLIFMIWPDKSAKRNVQNGIIALIGIFLTPWPTVIDLLLQNEYWLDLGIGTYEPDARRYLAGASQMGIAATALDLVVEFAFLSWAVRRHGWIIKGFEWSKIGMGPQMYFGANRKKEWEKANAKRVQRVVDAVMEMGVPAGTTKEQVEIITIAHNADINAVVEVVMKVDFVSVQGPDKSKV